MSRNKNPIHPYKKPVFLARLRPLEAALSPLLWDLWLTYLSIQFGYKKPTGHKCSMTAFSRVHAHLPSSAMSPAPKHMHRKAETIILMELLRISGLNMNS